MAVVTDEKDRTPLQESRLDTCLLATALLIICFGPAEWYTQSVCRIIMVAVILFDSVRRDWRTWLAAGLVVGAGTAWNWTTADNHKYLMCYWCIALCCTLAGRENRLAVLSTNGRLLTGFVMLFGAGWKLLSPVYRSGSFFEFTFLTDERFAGFVTTVTSLTREQLFENTARLSLLTTGYVDHINPQAQELLFVDSVRTLAVLTTWWTVGIEALCAFLFLAPLSETKQRWRHICLIVFAATTYVVAPVAGFGCLLMIMGMSHCELRDRKFYGIYLALFVAVLTAPLFVSHLFNAASASP